MAGRFDIRGCASRSSLRISAEHLYIFARLTRLTILARYY